MRDKLRAEGFLSPHVRGEAEGRGVYGQKSTIVHKSSTTTNRFFPPLQRRTKYKDLFFLVPVDILHIFYKKTVYNLKEDKNTCLVYGKANINVLIFIDR